MSDKNIEVSFEQFTALSFNLLKSVEYMHSFGVIHRDLKPQNILINANCNIKICDFGWSRMVPNEKKEAKKTRPMSPGCYSRFYRPPEIILDRTYNQSADIWSIGCIIAELYFTFLCTIDNPSKPSDNILFHGVGCFPLSP